jgi:DNA (cytosine-5)-methyltransferase 1
MWPIHAKYQHLTGIVDLANAQPLSERGAAGFLSRARRAKLRFVDGFLDDLEEHVAHMRGDVSIVA